MDAIQNKDLNVLKFILNKRFSVQSSDILKDINDVAYLKLYIYMHPYWNLFGKLPSWGPFGQEKGEIVEGPLGAYKSEKHLKEILWVKSPYHLHFTTAGPDFKSGFFKQYDIFNHIEETITKPDDPIDRDNALTWDYTYKVLLKED